MQDIIVFSLILLVFGVLPSIWFLKRKEKVDDNRKPNIIIVVLTTLLVLANTFFAYLMGQGSIAYVLGYVFVIPLILILIFGRTRKARWNTAFYTSLVIFLSILGNLITAANEIMKQGHT